MKPIQKYTMLAALAIALATPAFAGNQVKGGGRGGGGVARAAVARPQISHAAPAAHFGGNPGFHANTFHATQPRVVNRSPAFNRAAPTRSFAVSRARPAVATTNNRFTQNHVNNVNNAAVTNARFGRNNTAFNAQRNNRFTQGRVNGVNKAAVTNARGTRNSAAFNRSNRYGGRWFAGNTHSGWNRGGDHFWNHHHYRWYDGGWLIVDSGFWPYNYADPYPYYGYDNYDNQPPYVASYSGNSAAIDVQSSLAQQGYYNGPIDGDIGPMSQQAIANYQSDQGLPVTGNIDGQLLQSLGLQQ